MKCWALATQKLQLENPSNLKLITSPSTSISFPSSSPTTSECDRFLDRWGKPFRSQLGQGTLGGIWAVLGCQDSGAGGGGGVHTLFQPPGPSYALSIPPRPTVPPLRELSPEPLAQRWQHDEFAVGTRDILFPLQFSFDVDWCDR